MGFKAPPGKCQRAYLWEGDILKESENCSPTHFKAFSYFSPLPPSLSLLFDVFLPSPPLPPHFSQELLC